MSEKEGEALKRYDVENCEILRKERLTEDIYSVVVRSKMAQKAVPGQFAHILVPGKTLRRPISICEIEGDSLRFVFQVRGEGTEILAQSREGEAWDALLPLGNGFSLGDLSRKVCFVGGGIGVPPLLEAAKRFGKNALVITGFRNREAVILQEDFKRAGCGVILTTDDGSAGEKGLVTEFLPEDCEALFACGPAPMLKALQAEAGRRKIPCQISLEERMACGVGACLGCAVRLKADTEIGWRYGHVCKDGPVFDAGLVDFT